MGPRRRRRLGALEFWALQGKGPGRRLLLGSQKEMSLWVLREGRGSSFDFCERGERG